jgi:hypothetical protein
MSRYNRTGTHPNTGEKVSVAYGWDEVPGFEPGHFFQVFDPKNEDLTLINEGFLRGISEDRLKELKKQWKVR